MINDLIDIFFRTKWVKILSLLICMCFLISCFFTDEIEKILTIWIFQLIFGLSIILLFFTISFLALIGIWEIIRTYKQPNESIITTTLIYCATSFYIISIYFFNATRISSEIFKSEPKIEASYSQKDDYAFIKFRADMSFDSQWIGMIGCVWTTGTWKQNNDTIFLSYNNEKINALGDTVIIKDRYLEPTKHWIQNLKYSELKFKIVDEEK